MNGSLATGTRVDRDRLCDCRFRLEGINELVNFRLLVERLIAELTTEQHVMKQDIVEIRGDVGDLRSRISDHDVKFAEIGHARGIRQKPA